MEERDELLITKELAAEFLFDKINGLGSGRQMLCQRNKESNDDIEET